MCCSKLLQEINYGLENLAIFMEKIRQTTKINLGSFYSPSGQHTAFCAIYLSKIW